MKRRLGLLVLVVAIVVAAMLLFQHPVDADLELSFGPEAPSVRDATLVFTDSHERVVRDLRLLYPSGAPAQDQRRVRLPPGDYSVGVHLTLAGKPARDFNRPLHIESAGHYPLDLSGKQLN
jgi:hypothetical protein